MAASWRAWLKLAGLQEIAEKERLRRSGVGDYVPVKEKRGDAKDVKLPA